MQGGFPLLVTFKKPIFLRLFCLNFSSKTPWCSPVPLKYDPYNLQHWQKNCCKLIFCVLLEQLLSRKIFGRLDYYEVLQNFEVLQTSV